MRYIWTDSKNRRNLKLHGIAFEDAVPFSTVQPWSRWTIGSTTESGAFMPSAW